MCETMTPNSEQSRLLHDIGIIGFVVVEMTEYLDTHPTEKEAMEYLSHYVQIQIGRAHD